MQIYTSNQQDAIAVEPQAIERAALEILRFLEIECEELSVTLVDRETICQLHGEYMDDPSFTDCMTFPIDDEVLGEIVICPEAALLHCEAEGEEPLDELLLYLVHGICHLNGFDDLEEEERKAMRAEEKRILKHLEEKEISLR